MGETNWAKTWKIDTLNMTDWTLHFKTTSNRVHSEQKAKYNNIIRLVQGIPLIRRLIYLNHNLYQPIHSTTTTNTWGLWHHNQCYHNHPDTPNLNHFQHYSWHCINQHITSDQPLSMVGDFPFFFSSKL